MCQCRGFKRNINFTIKLSNGKDEKTGEWRKPTYADCTAFSKIAQTIYDKGYNSNQGIFLLSQDHKPNLPAESERIALCGGVVNIIQDEYGNKMGPPRVFKAGCSHPGLAMSRSLGDIDAKEVGVISTPQIIEYNISI